MNKLSIISRASLMLFSLIAASFTVRAGNGTSTTPGGNWDVNSSWVFNGTNRTPTCGDTVLIKPTATVTIRSQQNYTCTPPLYITVAGTLQFSTGSKLILPCGSVVRVEPGGQVRPGNGGGNSNLIEVCNTVLWTSGAGTLTGPVVLQQSPLPIELLHFAARETESSVILDWATASEINNDFFTLERSSDNIEWYVIGNVSGAGNSSSTLEYSFQDSSPIYGVSYYRLKQTDFDGTFVYFDPVAVNMNRSVKNTLVSASLDVNSARIIYLAEEKGIADIVIHSITGAEEYRTSVGLEKGSNNFYIATPSLGSGIHFISIEFGGNRLGKKATLY